MGRRVVHDDKDGGIVNHMHPRHESAVHARHLQLSIKTDENALLRRWRENYNVVE